MKTYHLSIIVGLLLIGLLISSYTDGDKDLPTAQPIAAPFDEENFSYAFGLMVGTDLKSRGMLASEFNADDFIKGLKAALGDENYEMDFNTAEQRVRSALQRFQEEALLRNRTLGNSFLTDNAQRKGVSSTPSGLQYEALHEGIGPKPTTQDKVLLHYEGRLISGTIFDSSKEQSEAPSLSVAALIKGWQEGLQLMSVGSKYKLYIPSELAYGDKGAGKVPPGSVLILEVELLAIR